MTELVPIEWQAPRVHDCTGSPGYPIRMIAMNYEWRELLVEHYNPEIRPGDQMIVGRDALTKLTYWVTRNEPHPEKSIGWSPCWGWLYAGSRLPDRPTEPAHPSSRDAAVAAARPAHFPQSSGTYRSADDAGFSHVDRAQAPSLRQPPRAIASAVGHAPLASLERLRNPPHVCGRGAARIPVRLLAMRP